MNKTGLIRNVAARLRISQKDARSLYDSLCQELIETLSAGASVNITGFGTFTVKKLEKRKGFNPLIEKWMMLPPRRKAQFKPSETLKKRVNLQ